jgi:hypothetical protein
MFCFFCDPFFLAHHRDHVPVRVLLRGLNKKENKKKRVFFSFWGAHKVESRTGRKKTNKKKNEHLGHNAPRLVHGNHHNYPSPVRLDSQRGCTTVAKTANFITATDSVIGRGRAATGLRSQPPLVFRNSVSAASTATTGIRRHWFANRRSLVSA